jgi:hypothetical protein
MNSIKFNDYRKIRSQFINISSENKNNIVQYRKYSLINIVLIAIFTFMTLGFVELGQSTSYESPVMNSVQHLLLVGSLFLIYGGIYTLVKNIALFYNFWKKQFLVNPNYPKTVASVMDWVFPLSFATLTLVAFPSMGIVKQLVILSMVTILCLIRSRATHFRYKAFERFKEECPPSYFDNIGGSSILRGNGK